MVRREPDRRTLVIAVPEVITMSAQTAVGWHVELEFEEDTHRTRAAALVRLPDGSEVRAHGYASRHPSDTNQPRVGEEVAGARALNELAMKMLTKAHDEIDEASGRTSHALR
ncbi:DUF1876 domain-containing protein [Streptomyces aureus]